VNGQNGSGPRIAANAAAPPLLQVEDLATWFPIHTGSTFRRETGHIRALDGVSLALEAGETVGVVGESGCGKSTLARTIVGLETATRGTVYYRGEPIAGTRGRRMRQVRRRIQMVFQDPYGSLNPRMTVEQIVTEPWRIHRDLVPADERRDRAQALLKKVGLDSDHMRRYPHQFSGGQRQRVGLARALTLDPEILVCDEPVSALDVSVRAQVINLLQDLQEDLGLSYIFIAHDLSIVRHIADRVAVMYLGKIVEFGTKDAIFEAPTHPYTQALLSAVPELDPARAHLSRPILLEGDLPSPANVPSGCAFRTRCWKVQPKCSDEEPRLEVRPVLEGNGLSTGHPSRCHYPEIEPTHPSHGR
jgi:oligopeptide transport system ATP-binding protein